MLDFAAWATEHASRIEKRVPGLKKKLQRAHQEYAAQLPVAKADGEDLTPEEADMLRQAISEMDGQPYFTALYDDLSAILAAGTATAADLLNIKIDMDGVKQSWAMDALRKHIEDFTFLVNEREQEYMNSLIDQGLADGWTPKRLKSEIATAFSDGYHIMNDGKLERTIPSDSWAEMVARTELNRAQTFGAASLYSAAGIQRVEWMATGGADECPECAIADGTVQKIGDPFDGVDVPMPPAHPRCNCAISPADDDVRLSDEELQAGADYIDRVNAQSRKTLEDYLNG